MLTTDYIKVLRGSAGLAGMTTSDIGTAELALFLSAHDRRLQAAWQVHRWPDLCRTEQRWFRAKYSATTSYAAGTERFDVNSGLYFQSLVAANLGNAPTTLVAGVWIENSAYWAQCKAEYGAAVWLTGTIYTVGYQVTNPGDGLAYQCIVAHTAGVSFDATKFGVLVPFERYVAFDQVEDDGTTYTAIGEFFYPAYDKNPRTTTKTVGLPFVVTERGATFVQGSSRSGSHLPFVWVEFRIRRPELAGEAWDSTAVYTSGQSVYFVTSAGVGNVWVASGTTAAGESPATAPAKWVVVSIPQIFQGYLIDAGFADWLTSDGQDDKALRREGMALGWLELEADKLQRQGGQVRRLEVRV